MHRDGSCDVLILSVTHTPAGIWHNTHTMRKLGHVFAVLFVVAATCCSAGSDVEVPSHVAPLVRPPGMALSGRHVRFPVQVRHHTVHETQITSSVVIPSSTKPSYFRQLRACADKSAAASSPWMASRDLRPP